MIAIVAATAAASTVHVETLLAIAASLFVILAALGKIARKASQLYDKVDKLDTTVTRELKPNGGGSMKDRSDQTNYHAKAAAEDAAKAKQMSIETNQLLRLHIAYADMQTSALRSQGLKIPAAPSWSELVEDRN